MGIFDSRQVRNAKKEFIKEIQSYFDNQYLKNNIKSKVKVSTPYLGGHSNMGKYIWDEEVNYAFNFTFLIESINWVSPSEVVKLEELIVNKIITKENCTLLRFCKLSHVEFVYNGRTMWWATLPFVKSDKEIREMQFKWDREH